MMQTLLAILAALAAFLFYELPNGLTLAVLVFLFLATLAPRADKR
jgi:hypothetical protein